MPIKHTPGWAITIKGDDFDLDDLLLQLAPPFDPWVEQNDIDGPPRSLLLRSNAWDELTEARDVAGRAERLVEMINGAMPLIYDGFRPIEKASGVIRFDEEGKRHLSIIVGSLNMTLAGMRLRATGTVGPGNKPPPQESRLQALISKPDDGDNRAELLAHLSRSPNWIDLYKAGELFRRIAGNQTALEQLLGKDFAQWKLVMWTANCFRHAPGIVQPPPSPATLDEAVQFLRKIFSTYL